MPTTEPESLGTFGEIEDDDELAHLDDPPIPFTIVGYTTKLINEETGEPDPDNGVHVRQEFTFHVRPTAGAGPLFNVLHHVTESGTIPEQIAAQFLFDALVVEDRDRFSRCMRDAEIEFKAGMLGTFAERLIERYDLRPSQSRSDRRSGPRRTGTTSTARSSGRRAAGSRTSPRPTR